MKRNGSATNRTTSSGRRACSRPASPCSVPRSLIVLVVSPAVAALSFTPVSWPAFAAGNLLIGLTYAAIGALAGAALGELGATHVVLSTKRSAERTSSTSAGSSSGARASADSRAATPRPSMVSPASARVRPRTARPSAGG